MPSAPSRFAPDSLGCRAGSQAFLAEVATAGAEGNIMPQPHLCPAHCRASSGGRSRARPRFSLSCRSGRRRAGPRLGCWLAWRRHVWQSGGRGGGPHSPRQGPSPCALCLLLCSSTPAHADSTVEFPRQHYSFCTCCTGTTAAHLYSVLRSENRGFRQRETGTRCRKAAELLAYGKRLT